MHPWISIFTCLFCKQLAPCWVHLDVNYLINDNHWIIHQNPKNRQALLVDSQTRPSEGTRQRRLARIIAQYKEGLKACEHSIRAFDYAGLPPPPRCPLLSGPPVVQTVPSAGSAAAGATHAAGSSATSNSTSAGDRTERIVALLKTRQNELKMLALKAKEGGNLDLARTYLRSALSINPMIESAQAGLVVDFSKLPRLPGSGTALQQPSGGLQRSVVPATGPILSGTECDPPAQFVLDMNAAESELVTSFLVLYIIFVNFGIYLCCCNQSA